MGDFSTAAKKLPRLRDPIRSIMPRLPLFLAACLPLLSLLPRRASAHCQLFPKSTCEQHSAFVPGHNLAGEGIDITTLQRKGAYLVDTSQWLDPNGTCVLCRNPLMDGQLQRLPLAGVDWRVHVACHRQMSSSVEHSDVDVAKALAGEVKNNWKMELNLPKEVEPVAKGQVVLVGARSQMVIYAHEKAQQDRYSFVRHEVSCQYYRLRLLPRPTLLSPHFSQAVRNLPSKHDPEEYQHFIDTYGTHYISQAQLGGRVRNLLAVRTCGATLAGLTASDIKDCLTLEASLGPDWISHSLSIKCHELRRNQAKGMFWEAYGQWRTEVVGGNSQVELLFAEPGEILQFSEWIENLKTSPGVVSYSLLPVHTLVDRGDPRREMLRGAVRDYIAQRALWRNCTQQCPGRSYASSKDPCMCMCEPDAITDTGCCARERGLARLRVHIQKGSGLCADHFSATDAYVKVFFQGREMRTGFVKDNNQPWWSETLDFGPIKLTGLNNIEVQVWDKDVWHDDLLATCHEGLVTGGKVWKKCYPAHGLVEYYYVLECGPSLGGNSCHDYVPQKQL